MSDNTEIAVLVTDPQQAEALRREIEALTGEGAMAVNRRGVDGATTAGLLVLATTAIQTLPAVLDAVTRLLRRGAVGEIEMTEYGVRITNPRPEDVAGLLAIVRGEPGEAPDG